jgi:hypothetical protein
VASRLVKNKHRQAFALPRLVCGEGTFQVGRQARLATSSLRKEPSVQTFKSYAYSLPDIGHESLRALYHRRSGFSINTGTTMPRRAIIPQKIDVQTAVLVLRMNCTMDTISTGSRSNCSGTCGAKVLSRFEYLLHLLLQRSTCLRVPSPLSTWSLIPHESLSWPLHFETSDSRYGHSDCTGEVFLNKADV